MNTYTVTEKDITNFHNARCSLLALQSELKDLFKEDSQIVKKIDSALALFNASFDRLSKESDANLEDKIDLFEKIRKEKNLSSIFSMFNVENINDIAINPSTKTCFPSKFTMTSYYSDKTVEYDSEIPPTYIDLWCLADILVQDSNDDHVFIENFRMIEDKVEVSLGS